MHEARLSFAGNQWTSGSNYYITYISQTLIKLIKNYHRGNGIFFWIIAQRILSRTLFSMSFNFFFLNYENESDAIEATRKKYWRQERQARERYLATLPVPPCYSSLLFASNASLLTTNQYFSLFLAYSLSLEQVSSRYFLSSSSLSCSSSVSLFRFMSITLFNIIFMFPVLYILYLGLDCLSFWILGLFGWLMILW